MFEHDLQMICKLLESRSVFVFSYFVDLAVIHLPHGLVVRIRRSHRRGPGSIPGVGMSFFFFLTVEKKKKKNQIVKYIYPREVFLYLLL